MSFQESPITRGTNVEGNGLGDSALDTSPQCITCFKVSRLLIGACGHECLMLRLWPKGQLATLPFGLGTQGSGWTGSTIGRIKHDFDAGLALLVLAIAPGSAQFSLRTGHALDLPINLEVVQVILRSVLGLPCIIRAHGHDQFDPIVLLGG